MVILKLVLIVQSFVMAQMFQALMMRSHVYMWHGILTGGSLGLSLGLAVVPLPLPLLGLLWGLCLPWWGLFASPCYRAVQRYRSQKRTFVQMLRFWEALWQDALASDVDVDVFLEAAEHRFSDQFGEGSWHEFWELYRKFEMES